ncbi:olfactory receptor 5G25-like [Hyperolius riggenbachi]|uniref:olfactory receptor 5G25-like n=1 Tax=Hyperolius riggenbachi TaxID=752182 RepID=UPI0035A39241
MTFILMGLTEDGKLAPFLFILFLFVYLVSIIANLGMMFLIYNTSSLQTPMYTFLSFLSLVDLCYSSVITPKMLADLLSLRKTISFIGCAIQFFFFDTLGVTEVLLLSAMSYDRYVAICHPLRYVSLMTRKKCLGLIFMVLSIGTIQSTVQTAVAFTHEYCGSNLINHFFCDVLPLLKLSCSGTLWSDCALYFFVGTSGGGSLMTILVSYTLIALSILQMKTSKSRKKAFSTCTSHLACLFIFYSTAFFSYMHPSNYDFNKQDRAVAVLYTVVIPMLNPLIYGLRNQKVKTAISQAFHRSF